MTLWGDNSPTDFTAGVPRALRTILLATGFAFLVQYVADRQSGGEFTRIFALSGARLVRGAVWQLGTYAFLHGGVWHLLVNLLALAVFGRDLEQTLGARRFVALYFACAALAGVGWLLLSVGAPAICVGASGAVFGIMGAFCALFPDRIITLLVFFVLPITLRARTLAIVLCLTTVLLLWADTGRVAHAAHLAGGAAGYLYGMRQLRRWRTGLPEPAGVGRPWRWIRSRARRRGRGVTPDGPPTDEEVDRVLDKVIEKGIDRLNARERGVLDRASRHRRQPSAPARTPPR